jgi:hypothetical protein
VLLIDLKPSRDEVANFPTTHRDVLHKSAYAAIAKRVEPGDRFLLDTTLPGDNLLQFNAVTLYANYRLLPAIAVQHAADATVIVSYPSGQVIRRAPPAPGARALSHPSSARYVLFGALTVMTLLVGYAIVGVLGLAATRRQLVSLLPLAYLLGLATLGMLAATAAVAGIRFGRAQSTAVAAVAFLLLARSFVRLPPGRPAHTRVGVAKLFGWIVAVPLLAYALAAFLQRSAFADWDAWAIWDMKARGLYAFGWATPDFFANRAYDASHLDYPLLVPGLDALVYRWVGGPSTELVRLEFFLIGAAFVGAVWLLLKARLNRADRWHGVLLVLTVPVLLLQLATGAADVPLATFVALGLLALALWLESGSVPYLNLGSIFLAAALLTKNEGLLDTGAIAIAGIAALALRREWRRVGPFALAIGAAVLPSLPWRIYVRNHSLSDNAFAFGRLLHPAALAEHAEKLPQIVRTLNVNLLLPTESALVVPTYLVAVVVAYRLGRRQLAAFGLIWPVLLFSGLTVVFLLSTFDLSWHLRSAPRVLAPLAIGMATLIPLLTAMPRKTPESASRLAPTERRSNRHLHLDETPDYVA